MGNVFLTPHELYRQIGALNAPLIFDVCKCEDFDAEPRLVPGSRWRDHQRIAEWAGDITAGRRVVAVCVRGADTARPDLAPEAAGLLAISLGISQLAGPDDRLALMHGFAVYDALYAWCRFARDETHNWPAKAA